MGLVTAFLGCQSNTEIEESNQSVDGYQLDIDAEAMMEPTFIQASLFMPNGIEIKLETRDFLPIWQNSFEGLKPGDKYDPEHIYTVVLWDELQNAYVLQLTDNGVKIGQNFYYAPQANQLYDWLYQLAGMHLFQSVDIERMILGAKDFVAADRQMPKALNNEIEALFKEAYLVSHAQEGYEIYEPLYPQYILQMEALQSVIDVTVITNSLISVSVGQDIWFYRLSHSITDILNKVMPVYKFSFPDMRSLFLAQSLSIRYSEPYESFHFHPVLKDAEVLYRDQLMLMTHHIIRLLMDSEMITSSDDSKETERHYSLVFEMSSGEEVVVDVFDDHFHVFERAYNSEGIAQLIHRYIFENNYESN
jgi:hypothetical protein